MDSGNNNHSSAPQNGAFNLGGDDANLNLRHYWHVVLERRWMVISVFISVMILTLIYLFRATPIYEATAVIQIDREYDNILNTSDAVLADSREQDYLQTQYKNLASRTLLEKVIAELELNEDEQYAKELNIPEALLDDIKITPIRLSRLVEVSAEHPHPQRAREIANSLVRNFVIGNLEAKHLKSQQVLDVLENQADSLRAKVTAARSVVQQYKETVGSTSLEKSQVDIVVQALNKARLDLSAAESEAASAQAVARAVEEQFMNQDTSLEVIPLIATDARIVQQNIQLAQYEAELDGLLVRYKDKWPAVMEVREKIASTQRTIRETAKLIYSGIQTEAEQAADKVAALQAEVDKKTAEQLELDALRIDYDDLVRKAEQAQIAYQMVLSRIEELSITGRSASNNMRVRDEAVDPLKPVKPRIILTLLMGIVGGVAIGVGFAFFVNYLDDSIKTQDDVETYLKLPFLGYVPNIKTDSIVERDLQAHLYPQSTAAESFRTLRATVSLMPKSDTYRMLAMTSTIPSEGKSLVASNLAIVFAQTGLKTLLVDADLRRPSVHKAFQLHAPQGLTDYLRGDMESHRDMVQTSEVPNLDVVCCGAIPDNPSELIGSKRMADLTNKFREEYDRIVLDCPPVSAVSDPLVLAARSDGVIFVNKFNKIRREHARRSIQRIQDAGIHILGVALNDIDFEGKDSYYYSYYYYQNRYYASHYKSEGTPAKGKAGGKEQPQPSEPNNRIDG